MSQFSVNGRSAATSGATDDCVCQFWHPSGTGIRVYVDELIVFRTGVTGSSWNMRRSTARGTPGSTVTPDADNAWEGDDAPASGVLLDLASFSTDPTAPALNLRENVRLNVVTGSGGVGYGYVFAGGLHIPPNTGLVLQSAVVEIIPITEVTVLWHEGAA